MGDLLVGKTAVVTGAAGGIGRGVALELAREGAAVLVSDLAGASAGGEETVALIAAEGGTAAFTPCDVTSARDCAALVDTALARFGRLDCAVNNAGIAVHKPLAEVTEEEYDRVLAVNLKGVFLGMRAQIPAMVERGGGAIVNVASVAGLMAVPLISPYTASKHGIIGLTRNAAMEYGTAGVRVNAVCPNAIRTPLMDASPPDFVAELIRPQAIPRVGEPEEVGFAVAYLCSDRAAFVTGVALPVDGGYAA
ncbi:NAD(P)-dependent dehydrogenase (short-subunit alcohol dehydrogenase family) [Pseudonocardia hierapolitana]|uniref:NAD(P)-dependent dehydrogenase (Short-subunit alcohol dehydrogenase family) n=1 Tax=Pseudonocardia hierapolitana TaxID=1128676 RepID=A0A561T1L7_9PSEU|nr:glucose 1-dehydrogenase [Pseudonocardia hierapolitana]TWF81018.1 NAD(P)-dependent dehydrogenase (short-subunit alcohol dehydrogenase family) [Pseudonocardia hierapolitana]